MAKTEPAEPTNPVSAGRLALARGAWEEARGAFLRALDQEETPEALEGLSWASWWLNDAEVTFGSRERAYRVYRERADRLGAARMAIWLAFDYLSFRGELAIANGWLQRARRLLEGLAPAPEHGWLALHLGAIAIEVEEDTVTARRLGVEVAQMGRSLGVPDLEMLGLALEGLALVSEGQVGEGMRRLDEAMAAALGGELREIYSVTWAGCYLIYACERVRDYDRAGQWCERMEEFSRRFQMRFVLGVCRAHYAGVLMWHGAWREAEAERATATEDLDASRPALAVEGAVRLAELRRRQGRLEEAAALFEQVGPHPLALLGRAELALDAGAPATAADLVERFLRHLTPENRTQRAAALELLVRIQVALGDQAGASKTLRALQAIASAVATQPLRAAASFSEGVVAAADRNHEAARRQFEDAVDLFERSGAPFEAARSRIELASVLSALGRSDAAEQEARAALQSLQQIGATRETLRAVAVLRDVEAARRREAVGSPSPLLTSREVEVLRLVAEGLNDREIAARLVVSEHTVHRHISNVLTKLGLPSRAAAVAHAAKHGLL